MSQYLKLQEAWVAEHSIKEGSKVQIGFSIPDHLDIYKFGPQPNTQMLEYSYPLDAEVRRVSTTGSGGIYVLLDNGKYWYYPYYALIPIAKPRIPIEVKLNDQYTAVVTEKIVVGCQTLTEEHLDRIEEAFKKIRS